LPLQGGDVLDLARTLIVGLVDQEGIVLDARGRPRVVIIIGGSDFDRQRGQHERRHRCPACKNESL
jgi:hypothetical protein